MENNIARMQFYMAPMEGLTGYIYRNAYEKHFGGIDRYFTPFITNKKLNHKEINDVLPQHNVGMQVVPQILTNRAEDFVCIAKELEQYGYEEVNLNLGCPSGTVTAKNRGAGFLALPEELDAFLEEIFADCPLKISIKTRIGKEDSGEWERLLAIYEKYPLSELIVHPRVQKDFYKNTPDMEAFLFAMEHSRHSLCYNGDIHSRADYDRLCENIQEKLAGQTSLEKVMLGRGILKNPGLVQLLRMGESKVTKEKLHAFHDDILHGYQEVMSGDKNTLFKMKELWFYLGDNFMAPEKYLKKIKKAERLIEYETVVAALFREQELKQMT